MWLLIAVILAGSQVQSVEVLETYIRKQDCLNRGEQASKIGIPLGMTLNCIPLNGVRKVYAERLRKRVPHVSGETNTD
tara:strand:+ start:587 stop:820 length:234 start_codon:yes stop_codon:yes gene_type:complete